MKNSDPKLLKLSGPGELKEGASKKFVLKGPDRETEAFLILKKGKYYAYLNLCRHWSVGLDFDDNDFFTEDGRWLVCKNHGAVYDPQTGECQGGPCGGASLYRVPLVEKKGTIYAELDKIDWGE
jgi:nitrite reductase/ring-hydroxylating ferredoxin subunit